MAHDSADALSYTADTRRWLTAYLLLCCVGASCVDAHTYLSLMRSLGNFNALHGHQTENQFEDDNLAAPLLIWRSIEINKTPDNASFRTVFFFFCEFPPTRIAPKTEREKSIEWSAHVHCLLGKYGLSSPWVVAEWRSHWLLVSHMLHGSS